MRVACVTTVADESRLLSRHIEHQRHLGVDEFHVFCDPEAGLDASALYDQVRRQPGVVLREGVDNAQAREHWPGEDYGAASAFVFRQGCNSARGLAEARRRGADWVLNLDADELLCLDLHDAPRDGLKQLLARVPEDRPAVHFPCLEVVQAAEHYDHVFAQETRFKNLFIQTPEGIEQTDLRHRVRDPATGAEQYARGYYGPVHGKGAVRAAYPADALGWAWRSPRTRRALVDFSALDVQPVAFVLHYYRYDFEDFWNSFAVNFGAGRVERGLARYHRPLKSAWFDVVARHRGDREAVREYFRRWVMLDGDAVNRSLAAGDPRAGFVRVTAPSRFFGTDAAPPPSPPLSPGIRLLGASKDLVDRQDPPTP